MSDYHILKKNEVDTVYRVVFHFPIADIQNNANFSVRTIVAGLNPEVSAVTWIDPADPTESDKLPTGEIYELVDTIPVGKGNTGAAKLQRVADKYNEHVTETLPGILDTHDQYGRNGMVT